MRILRACSKFTASLLACLAFAEPALAASGSLDPTFGTFGVARLAPMTGSALAVQPDGKVILAGAQPGAFAVTRLASDGSVDPTYGVAGVGRRAISAAVGAATLVLQPDGKALVAAALPSAVPPSIALARFDAQGNNDNAFGVAGLVATPFNDPPYGGFLQVTGMALDASGRILVGAWLAPTFYLIRFNANGSLDGRFGSGGVVTASVSTPDNALTVTYGPLLRADGRMLAFGTTRSFPGNVVADALTVLRFESDGMPDATFGTGGRVINASQKGELVATHAVLQNDGRLLVSGIGSGFAIWLARLTPDGALDAAFAAGGKSSVVLGTDRLPNAHFETWLGGGATVALTPDGGSVQVGSAYDGFGFVYALVRRTSDGSLDDSFGHGGRVLGPPGTGGAEASAVDVAASRVWVAGASHTTPLSVPVARFVLTPSPETIVLASSANPAAMTQPVAITASITRTGSASGVVSFLDAGAPIDGCQEVAVITPSASPSIATCTATLTAGVHAIAAAYSGDVTHAPQISDALIQRITPDGTTTLIEFFNARLDDYFLTSEAEEIAALDSGATPGWTRTGQSFLAFAPDANRVKPMCRWFSGSTFAPVSVHFYSVSEGECYRPAGAWVFEANVAPLLLPQPAGFCPTGTTQLYRLYNNSQDGVSRHRYTTSLAEWLAMTQRGWIGEGEGMGVMACVPT